LKADFIISKLI